MDKDQTPRQEALSFLADRLEEWREESAAGECPDALSVEPRLVTRVVITIGGPAAWIEYDHRYGTAELYTTYSGEPVTVELTADEAAEVCELFALDRADHLVPAELDY